MKIFEALTFAQGASEVLEVVVNKFNIKVNGKAVGSTGDNYTLDNRYKVPLSIIYKGTTYFFETSYLCL